MAVALGKVTDTQPAREFAFLHTPVWLNTVKLYNGLANRHGEVVGDALYDALSDNNLEGLRTSFAARPTVDLTKPLGGTYRENWKTPQVDTYLRQWEGPLSAQTSEDLRRNDLRGLDTLLYLMRWDPTPGQ
jgi:hypothetical protein